MNVTTTKTDTANVLVTAKIENADIEKRLDKIATKIAKTVTIDGFRKGKVPPSRVKQIYKEKIIQDAESEVITEIIEIAKKDLDLKAENIIGQPLLKRYEKTNDGIDTELLISLRPTIEIDKYEELAPKYEEPTVEEEEIKKRLDLLIEQSTPFKKIKEDRELQEGDMAVFDFVGKIDGKEFKNGKAENFELVIGSRQFIDGFETQMIGMKKGEVRDVTVVFPKNYQSDELAGKEAVFTITLNDIKTRTIGKFDDEMAKRLLPGYKDATTDIVKEQIVEQLKSEKLRKIYYDELKPKYIDALISNYDFDLPENIVEQEIDVQVNQRLSLMTEKERNEYNNDKEKMKELRESLRKDAVDSVKVTFIIDDLARKEGIVVSDEEVTRVIYNNAINSGQDPKALAEHYKENNLIPAIKMGIMEDRLIFKIMGLDEQ